MNFTSKDNMKNLKRNQFNYHQRIHTQKLAKNILCRIIQGKFLQSFERNMTLQENEGQILKVRSMQDFIHHVYMSIVTAFWLQKLFHITGQLSTLNLKNQAFFLFFILFLSLSVPKTLFSSLIRKKHIIFQSRNATYL